MGGRIDRNGAIAQLLVRSLHAGQRRGLYAPAPSGRGLARRVAELCPRRWGKTDGKLRYMVARALTIPGYSGIYTRELSTSARENAWPLLVDCGDQKQNAVPILSQYAIEARTNENSLKISFPNGSRIRLLGSDHPRFARLIRGGEHNDVVVDEAQEYRDIDVAYLVREVIRPTLLDRRGRLFLCGTPGLEEAGYFWEVMVAGLHPEYERVVGGPEDNVYNYAARMAEEAELRAANPNLDNEPWFRREYRAEWVSDSRHLLVPVGDAALLREWPYKPDDGDHYILGIWWGDRQPSAYCLAYANPRQHNRLVFLEGWSAVLTLNEHLDAIATYRTARPRVRIVLQAHRHSKDVVAQLSEGYRLPVEELGRGAPAFTLSQLSAEAKGGALQFYHTPEPHHPERHPVYLEWRKLAGHRDPRTSEEVLPTSPLHQAALLCRRAACPQAYQAPAPAVVLTEQQKIRNARMERIRNRLARSRRGSG